MHMCNRILPVKETDACSEANLQYISISTQTHKATLVDGGCVYNKNRWHLSTVASIYGSAHFFAQIHRSARWTHAEFGKRDKIMLFFQGLVTGINKAYMCCVILRSIKRSTRLWRISFRVLCVFLSYFATTQTKCFALQTKIMQRIWVLLMPL